MRTILIERDDGQTFLHIFDDTADVETEIAKWQSANQSKVVLSHRELAKHEIGPLWKKQREKDEKNPKGV